jgi:hypothetical protein
VITIFGGLSLLSPSTWKNALKNSPNKLEYLKAMVSGSFCKWYKLKNFKILNNSFAQNSGNAHLKE